MQSLRKYVGIGGVTLLIAAGAFFAFCSNANGGLTPVAEARNVTVYRSPTCGCCANYISYLKRAGFTVETITTPDMEPIKARYGVPSDLVSCHTTVAGDYVIEGHVPIEGINALFN